jgi:multiple sugar transport system substrate-binding protein
MALMRRLTLLAATAAMTMLTAQAAFAQTEVRFARFFGSCEADFGTVTDPSTATNECGVITALTNQFNADNPDIKVVTETVEWAPYYEQLAGRLAAGDIPDVSVMHADVLGEFARRGLLTPLGDDFAKIGIDVDDFVASGRENVEIDGQIFGLPQDFVSWLWHTNKALFKQAGMLDDKGNPIMPTSIDELFKQAAEFKQATGKPYLALPVDSGSTARIFYTLVWQQGGTFFPEDNKHIVLQTPEAVEAVSMLKRLVAEGLAVAYTDGGVGNSDFQQGNAGVVTQGTWMIAPFAAAADNADMALDDYGVYPLPQLYAENAQFSAGHTWVMLKNDARSEEKRQAALKFIKFLYDHNGDWARAGHLPSRQSVLDSAEFQALPYRQDIMSIPANARHLPNTINQQRVMFFTIGEEVSAAIIGQKSVEQALADAENRVNAVLRRAR